ncbi:MAG: CoA pyrophosphatase [Alphaproteobacteria bacterium]|nr:CoA pyrophosphatase [Alphaproteobacteria bacterium]MBU6472990.1 CoA pyrophosphatase [Alphaproteobacteria bacterium]MDE2013736.1 CoA pyrophosphatase [Alphaproteobacteria bacterium]MDE2073989.1 CoA pyrophosphatase [Alphaproteobacteria bacterium]MDE2350886.1 CoA pyrophosphatase [Alphaproteobacteria bacterium]
MDLPSLASRLLPEAPALSLTPTRSDYDLDPEHRPDGPRKLKPAAVLMPIVRRDEPTVLFTKRTAHLARHAGQVSFPGGRVHENDASLVETALRETREETGIAADYVSIAGFLDSYETGTGFAIVPVVGLLREGFTLHPDPGEVEEVFEVPLAFLLDPANHRLEAAEWKGRKRRYHAFTYGRHYIWGATAAILVGFAERLKP